VQPVVGRDGDGDDERRGEADADRRQPEGAVPPASHHIPAPSGVATGESELLLSIDGRMDGLVSRRRADAICLSINTPDTPINQH